jgi:hypothetical protein
MFRAEGSAADSRTPLWVLPSELMSDSPLLPTPVEPLEFVPLSAIPAESATPLTRSTRRLVILPTLNEEKGLEVTLRELFGAPFRSLSYAPSILVVDGKSTDGTREVAASWDVPILVQLSKGKGAAVREGIEWADDRGFSSVAVMDADATYPTGALPALFHLLDSGRQLVVGVRRPDWPATRSARDMIHRVGNGLLNFTAAQLTGEPVLDICSGFWGVRTEAMNQLTIRSDGFEIESELFINAFRAGLDVAQFPIAYRERVGDAKLHAIRDGARILLSILHHSLKPAPAPSRRTAATSTPVVDSEDLDSLLLSLAPQRVVIVAAPARMAEASDHMDRLRRAIPSAQVTTEVLDPDGISNTRRATVEEGVGHRAEDTPAVIVALPRLNANAVRPDRFLVEMPQSRRLIRVGTRKPGPPLSSTTVPLRTPGLRRERLPGGRLAALFILSAAVDSSGVFRELAFLAANQGKLSTQVFRRSRSFPRDPQMTRWGALRIRSNHATERRVGNR